MKKRKTTQWERNKHLFQQLIDNSEFQERIIALRSKWGIPKNGYKKAGPEWENRIAELSDKYFDEHREEDKKLWKESEQKALKREISWGDYEEIKEQIHYKIPINGFYHDIDLIIKDLKVSPNWRENIKQYLLLNNLEAMWLPVGITHTVPMRDFPDTITITIDAHTTKEDLLERWPDIERAQKKLRHKSYSKYQPYASYELHKRLYELKASGMKLKEISEKTGVPYNYINIYINRYLDHINRK